MLIIVNKNATFSHEQGNEAIGLPKVHRDECLARLLYLYKNKLYLQVQYKPYGLKSHKEQGEDV